MVGLLVERRATWKNTVGYVLSFAKICEAFFINKTILGDKNIHVAARLRYIDRVITQLLFFGCGHRTVQTRDLQTMDVACRRLLRKMMTRLVVLIGRTRGMKSHTFGLTECPAQSNTLVGKHGPNSVWLKIDDWGNLWKYVPSLPLNRWVRRALHRRLGHWLTMNENIWSQQLDDFIDFWKTSWSRFPHLYVSLLLPAPSRVAIGMQARLDSFNVQIWPRGQLNDGQIKRQKPK